MKKFMKKNTSTQKNILKFSKKFSNKKSCKKFREIPPQDFFFSTAIIALNFSIKKD